MKTILTDGIIGAVGQPVKSGTLQHLQSAYAELVQIALQTITGAPIDTSVPRILYGLRNTGSGSTYTINAGAVLYDGKLYEVAAASFTAATGAVVIIDKTYLTAANADPVTMTDGSFRNVHEIATMSIVDGDSSTAGYVFDFADMRYFSQAVAVQTALPSSAVHPAAASALYVAADLHSKTIGGFLYLDGYIRLSGTFGTNPNQIQIDLPQAMVGGGFGVNTGGLKGVCSGYISGVTDDILVVEWDTSNQQLILRKKDNSNFAHPGANTWYNFSAILPIYRA